MTTVATTWRNLPPRRGALARLDLADPNVWSERLRFDREREARYQSPELAAITKAVKERAREVGAAAVVLSGSTARGRRTQVSDLDYHVIGTSSLGVTDLPEDIDLYADEADRFQAKLRKGDDFAHWSVWYGCVLFDSGVVRDAAAYVAEHDAWPDPERKLRQARGALDFAEQMAASGDYGATLEQVRGALSLTARWLLLSHDVFPLARDELSEQLEQLGQVELALALRRSIRQRPSAEYLRRAIARARAISQGRLLPSGRVAV
jgi:predicted nucleotidyltransferase